MWADISLLNNQRPYIRLSLPWDIDHVLLLTQKHPERRTDSLDGIGDPLPVIMLRNISAGVLSMTLRQQSRTSVISVPAYLQNHSVVKGHKSGEGTSCEIYCTSKGIWCETDVKFYTAICWLSASIFISVVSTLKF